MDEAAGGCDCRVVVVTVSAQCTRQPPARATSLPWPIDTHSMYIRINTQHCSTVLYCKSATCLYGPVPTYVRTYKGSIGH